MTQYHFRMLVTIHMHVGDAYLCHHPISECSASSPDRRHWPGSTQGLLVPVLRRSGPVLRRPAPPRSPSRPGSSILSRGASLRVIGTRVRTLRRRSPAARRAPSGDTRAGLLRGWTVAAGWKCKIRVGLSSMFNPAALRLRSPCGRPGLIVRSY